MERMKLKLDFNEPLKTEYLIFQISVWILLIILIVLGFLYNNTEDNAFAYKISLIILGAVLLPILLLIYYILEFTSDIFEKLKNIRKYSRKTNIIEFLKDFFKKEPAISFHSKIFNTTYGGYEYKYDIDYETDYDYYGEIEREIHTCTKVWNKDKENITVNIVNSHPFSVYSFRDISEKLVIERKIAFLELDIKQELYFADKISLLDAKNEMKKKETNKNQNEIIYFEVKNNDHKNYSLMINNSIFLSPKTFIFFIIIGMAELYKCYLKSICQTKYLVIKKIISTRDDLFSDSNNKLYQNQNPIIIYKNVKYKFANFGYTKNDYKPVIPSQQEIEEAKKLNEEDERNFLAVNKNTKININNEMESSDFSNEYKAFK